MAMLTLNGTLINIYEVPETTDKKTGEIIPACARLQIQGENTLQNGQKRMELHSLKVPNATPYTPLLNKPIRVPVGVFASGHGVIFYALKNAGDQG